MWVEMESGKKMLVDLPWLRLEDVKEGDVIVTPIVSLAAPDVRPVQVYKVVRCTAEHRAAGYRSHFATCPDAGAWRKRKEAQ